MASPRPFAPSLLPSPIVFIDTRTRLPAWARAIIRRAATTFPHRTVLAVPDPSQLASDIPEALVIGFSDLSGVRDRLHDFRSLYMHLSTAPEDYERACFERFIVLEAIMKQYSLQRAWHLDTDALPLSALVDMELAATVQDSGFWALASYGEPPTQLGESVSAGNALLSIGAVSQFVNLVLGPFYQEHAEALRSFYEERSALGLTGGVCDMTAWGLLAQHRGGRGLINSNDSLIGGALNINSLYQLNNQLTRCGVESGGRFPTLLPSQNQVFVAASKDQVPASIIHFSGADKEVSRWIMAGLPLRVNGPIHQILRLAYRFRRRAISSRWPWQRRGRH